MLALVLAVVMCLSVYVCVTVSVSVTRQYCIKMVSVGSRKHSHVRNSSFLTPTVVGVRPPSPVTFVLKVTHPAFEHNDFDQYPLIVPQP